MYDAPRFRSPIFAGSTSTPIDVLAGLRERDRERQPDVAQADDSDAHARTR